jgi:hypothetical protein
VSHTHTHTHLDQKDKDCRKRLNARIKFPKTPGLSAGVYYAIEVALHNQNWNAALAMLSHIKLEQIERDLRLEDDSILDGVKVKEMPNELKKLCKAAVATCVIEVNEPDEKVRLLA